VPVGETLQWLPLRRELGVGAFGVNAYRAANAGDDVVEDHDETGSGAGGHEELYVVLSGHARFTVAGEQLDAPSGTVVFVRDPAARRHAVAEEPGTTVLAVGGAAGEAYRVSAWEHYFSAIPLARAGDPGAAADLVAEGLAEYGENGSLLYNLACYESLAGRTDDALAHLRRALELQPKLAEWAAKDSDLDPIRAHQDFPC
jgi:tetratricopeptide (TPR) repeat protein